MHKSRLGALIIDCKTDDLGAAARFWSEALGRSFGLALVKAGRSRHGETLFAPLESGVVPVKLVDPVHYDKKGERRDG